VGVQRIDADTAESTAGLGRLMRCGRGGVGAVNRSFGLDGIEEESDERCGRSSWWGGDIKINGMTR